MLSEVPEPGYRGPGQSERVYKALRNQLAAVLDELKRIEAAGEFRDELLDNIELITRTLYGMKEGSE